MFMTVVLQKFFKYLDASSRRGPPSAVLDSQLLTLTENAAMENIKFHRTRDNQVCCFRYLLMITLIVNTVCLSAAQTVGNEGLCSTTERSTVAYPETYQTTRAHKTYRKCGFLGWSRCTQYRVVYVAETRMAYRETSNLVFVCCNGWAMQPDGSCLPTSTVSDQRRGQSEPTSEETLYTDEGTSPAPIDKTTTIFAGESSPSVSTSSEEPPAEIAKPGGPRSVGNGGDSDSSVSDQENLGMIGGVVGVAVALIVMVSLMIIFVSRKKRRSRDKRIDSDPAVVFELLNSNSPPQGPVPDIYTEIPDRADTGKEGGASSVQGNGHIDADDGYDAASKHPQHSRGAANTYQDVRELGNSLDEGNKAEGACDGSPNMKKVNMEVRLGKNGAVYSKARDEEKSMEVHSPYQNVPNLDVAIQPPEIYDTVDVGADNSAAYNKLDRANSKPPVPTDPDDEAYNMVMIGPSEGGQSRYDRLDRQRDGSQISADAQLDTPIPAAPGYSALGPDTRLGYDKLERHETHNAHSERKAGSTGPNTYSELGAQSRKTDYDKLTRRHSDDHGLNISDANSRTTNGVPNGSEMCRNEYDTIEIGKPADGEIYENLPKKPHQNGLTLKMPPREVGNHYEDMNRSEQMPSSSPLTSPVARPVYDVIPGSAGFVKAPVYDTLPTSPRETGNAPVYDTPPACPKAIHRVSCEDPVSPEVGGARPVYDTPPVRSDNICPLQFKETVPVYENTPTGPR